MSANETDLRPSGPLARIGQNDAFAGFSRIFQAGVTVVLGGIMSFALSSIARFEDRLNADERAILTVSASTAHNSDLLDALTGRTTDRVEALDQRSKEFRLWAEARTTALQDEADRDREALNKLDNQERENANRIRCLEHHTTCAP